MKALFVHDHPFIKNVDTGRLYTSGNLNSALWERYLKHFETITVIGRCHIENDTTKYLSAEREAVRFELFSDVKGGIDYFFKRNQIKQKLMDEIEVHDIVILRFPSLISMFAAEYCMRNKIKYVVEVVGCAWDANWNYGGILPKLLAPYTYLRMKKMVKNAFATIYVTEKFLQRRYPTNAAITNHASNVVIKEVHEEALDRRLKRVKSEGVSGRVNIGIIGNINVKYKGYDILLKAISLLSEDLKSRIRISFVGGGDSRYLKSLIKECNLITNCFIVGKLKSGQEIFTFLDELDLYIHPSKQEGLPRSVIEAMSRACPVLASSVAGIPELIAKDFLHKPGDYRKLSRDIVRLVEDDVLQKESAKMNFNRSKDYLFSVLEDRRYRFFQSVKSSITNFQ